MNATKLYVIGNGFDLWHGIPSSFRAFKRYVHAADRDVHREVEDYLPAGEDWSELEQALAQLDADQLVENLGHFMGSYGADDWSDSGHHDFQYEVENVVERLSTGLRTRFAEWVRGLPIPTRETAPRLLFKLDRQALFLTFNYTDTLSAMYGVHPQHILFIHGCAAQPDDELVLGHAWNPLSRRSLNDHPGIEDVDTRLVEAHSIIDDYFSATFKHSAELIARHGSFFKALSDVEEVVVLGHSLLAVDAAYFHALREQPAVANANWTIAVRDQDEWLRKVPLLAALGIRPGQAAPIAWNRS